MKRTVSTLFEKTAHARLKKLRKSDPQKNLVERFRLICDARPDLAERRLGYVPMIIEHGWAIVAIPEEGFAFTIGLKYRFDQNELLVAAPSLKPQELKQLLNMVALYVSLGNRIGPNEPVDLTDFDVSLTFKPYSHKVFEKYATGYLASFEQFFDDRQHETGDTLPVLWTELRAKPKPKPTKTATKKRAKR
jgi:hypothetical protein